LADLVPFLPEPAARVATITYEYPSTEARLATAIIVTTATGQTKRLTLLD
jgi:hypothetical protein